MSLRIPTRRLAEPVTAFRSLLRGCPSCNNASPFSPLTLLRTKATSDKPRAKPSNPVLDNYLKQKPAKKALEQPEVARGQAADNSIFEDEYAERDQHEGETPAQEDPSERHELQPEFRANILDPDPANRMIWERKRVIRQVQKRGRLTKAQQLKRIERESLSKSQWMMTSTKKLGMLARQLAGKPIDEAIAQMQYSKKKIARDVKQHLEYARDMAIVNRGLGLGKVEGRAGEPVEIQLKDGKRHRVKDRTGIYVDQAWVGRGMYTSSPEFRARGRVNMLRHPHATISVVLKEEATRIRLSEERQKKKLNRKLWLHLPDRPISQQRQYPLW